MILWGLIPGYAPLGSPRYIPERPITRYARDTVDVEQPECVAIDCHEPAVTDGDRCHRHG